MIYSTVCLRVFCVRCALACINILARVFTSSSSSAALFRCRIVTRRSIYLGEDLVLRVFGLPNELSQISARLPEVNCDLDLSTASRSDAYTTRDLHVINACFFVRVFSLASISLSLFVFLCLSFSSSVSSMTRFDYVVGDMCTVSLA